MKRLIRLAVPQVVLVFTSLAVAVSQPDIVPGELLLQTNEGLEISKVIDVHPELDIEVLEWFCSPVPLQSRMDF